MKVAICISGQLRTFKECLPSQFKNLIEPLQADVFIHCWDKLGETHKSTQIPHNPQSALRSSQSITYDLLEKHYTPRAALIEPFSNTFYDQIGPVQVPSELREAEPMRYKGALPMAYGMKECLKLKQHAETTDNQTYDLVVRLRPDAKVLSPIPDHCLQHTQTLWWSTWPDLKQGVQVSDKLAFSASSNMDYYLSLYDSLETHWKVPLGNGQFKNIMVGERLMRKHINSAPFANSPIGLPLELIR